MSNHYHALVWLDHREAKVFHFNATESEHVVVKSTHHGEHIHHHANSGDSGHVPVDHAYLEKVAHEIASAGAILVAGPGNARKELMSYLESRNPALAAKVTGLEAADHPTDGELLAHARKFFHADDRMHSQIHPR
ncbi:MAG: translational machinery protein [Gammaproteobacteria bacterium]